MFRLNTGANTIRTGAVRRLRSRGGHRQSEAIDSAQLAS
jgi:hypothetical protein